MLIITILYAIIFYQIARGFWEEGAHWYKDPRCWLHVISFMIIAGIYGFN